MDGPDRRKPKNLAHDAAMAGTKVIEEDFFAELTSAERNDARRRLYAILYALAEKVIRLHRGLQDGGQN